MYKAAVEERPDRYKVSVDQFRTYHEQGYVVVPGLVEPAQIAELKSHAMDIFSGKVSLEGVEPPAQDESPAQIQQRLTRIHMLHRRDEPNERFMLHPRLLDVVEVLVGPDVLCLQTMMFYNAPGTGGQGWHQDAYYITTYPDSLIGAWLALDDADEENGCMHVVPGSHKEPIHPDAGRGALVHAQEAFADLGLVENISHLDDGQNSLSKVAGRYPAPQLAEAKAGDVVFFHSRLLHRSYPNRSADRWRRAFVSHYCNARSWVPWGGEDGVGANHLHILGRGTSHLPYAQPRFATPCAALAPAAASRPFVAHGADMEKA
jgi:phytanoyl-CoA hydroxylase